MKLSLIIPVYNEAGHLHEFFALLFKQEFPCAVEYVVVDDCSQDGSWDIIEQSTNGRSDVTIFRKPQNGGKGSALRKGIELASGDIICIQDADFEYDPSDVKTLVQPILDGRADVVYGSRFHSSSPQVHRTFHYLVNRILTLLSNLFSGLYLTDMETCYKVFRAEIIKGIRLESDRFGFEPEVTAKIAKLNLRVWEFPISYFPRNYLQGKKIGWKDGVEALYLILKYNLQSAKLAFFDSMPERFIPKGRQWL
jgi:glycosyltransferase involved in cell wall biosynthesis